MSLCSYLLPACVGTLKVEFYFTLGLFQQAPNAQKMFLLTIDGRKTLWPRQWDGVPALIVLFLARPTLLASGASWTLRLSLHLGDIQFCTRCDCTEQKRS